MKDNDRSGFARVYLETSAGELEARLDDSENWELRVRRRGEITWRLACSGDLDCSVVTPRPILGSVSKEPIVLGPVTIDRVARRVSVDDGREGGSDLRLAPKEFGLLLVLASEPDRTFTTKELLESVWGREDDQTTRTVNTHASRLRKQLAVAGAEPLIINFWSVGYRFWNRKDWGRGSAALTVKGA